MNTLYPILSKYILADPNALVIDLNWSHDSWLVDEHGKERLDCFSQYASQPLGWNHPKVIEKAYRLYKVCLHNPANSDMYCREYAEFVETFAQMTPDFKHHFFIAGGSLGVENALKAAFDWKAKKANFKNWGVNGLKVIYLKQAFHGRTGYTLTLTNTDPRKTDLYPTFNWIRVENPKICEEWPKNQERALEEIKKAMSTWTCAAFIMEPIQGEGGDNHFDKSFFQEIRKLCDQYETLLIFDEVQSGVGLTGKMWAYEHFDIKPDLMAFGKKVQVCGCSSTTRIDEIKDNVFVTPSRINSTWGGNLTDMVRSTIYMGIIKEDKLIENAAEVGEYFKKQLESIGLSNLRGRGLMIAFDFEDTNKRNDFLYRLSENMLAIKCGERSVRLRPHLTFTKEHADLATAFIKKAHI